MWNLSLAFHKTYYDTLTATAFNDVEKANQAIFSCPFFHELDYQAPAPMVSHHFVLTVCYPGLLIGTAIPHDSATADKELSRGFNMDYVTGQPCLNASSVKGFLRNLFREHRETVAALCDRTPAQVQALEAEIFDDGDIFFDAVIYDGYRGFMVGPDYISPHLSTTQSPVSMVILKLLPGVRLSFRFRLADTLTMTAEEKEALFKKLLTSFSFGSKRNSGYGILREDETGGAIEVLRAKCPHCNATNFRYNKTTKAPNTNWPNCFKCQQPLF